MNKLLDMLPNHREFYPNKYVWLFVAGLKTYFCTHSFSLTKEWYWNKEVLSEVT